MFYVGQKVVAVKTIDIGGIFEGKIYTITATTNCPKCGLQHVTYGVKHGIVNAHSNCSQCHTNWAFDIGEWCPACWVFAPLEEYSDSMSIAMQLVQEIDQVDKAKNPVKTPQTA